MGAWIELGVGLAGVIGVAAMGLAALPWSEAEVESTEGALRGAGARAARWLWEHRPAWGQRSEPSLGLPVLTRR